MAASDGSKGLTRKGEGTTRRVEKRKKPRKPRNFPSDTFTEVIQNTVFVEGGPYHPKQARKLAKWLESAADYLEARKK